jgi:hypothetical protein
VANLVIRCHKRDVTLSLELRSDLAVERLLVGLDCQEEVGPLLLELPKNGRCVWSASAWMSTPSRSSSPGVESPPPRLREVEVIALVERSITLFEQLGGLDQRDQLLFKDIVRSNVLTASSGLLPGTPTDQELTLGDAWLEVFQQALPRNQFCAAGKLVARAYREEFGEEPPCRQQFVDGAPRQVKSYRRSWLIETLKRFRAQLAGG